MEKITNDSGGLTNDKKNDDASQGGKGASRGGTDTDPQVTAEQTPPVTAEQTPVTADAEEGAAALAAKPEQTPAEASGEEQQTPASAEQQAQADQETPPPQKPEENADVKKVGDKLDATILKITQISDDGTIQPGQKKDVEAKIKFMEKLIEMIKKKIEGADTGENASSGNNGDKNNPPNKKSAPGASAEVGTATNVAASAQQ